jgi:hypothetical protein
MRSANAYLNRLPRLHIFTSLLALGLLFFSPTLPGVPTPGLTAVLSGSRSVLCLLISFVYVSAFLGKQTRFSPLMSIALLLLAFGYALIVQMYFVADLNQALSGIVGDIIRIRGLAALLTAVLLG